MPDLDPHQARPITPEGVANIRARIITALGGLDAVPAGSSIEEVLDLLLQNYEARQKALAAAERRNLQLAARLDRAVMADLPARLVEIDEVRRLLRTTP